MSRKGKPSKHRRYNICKLCFTDIDQTQETHRGHLESRHDKTYSKKSMSGSTLNYYFTRQELIGIAL